MFLCLIYSAVTHTLYVSSCLILFGLGDIHSVSESVIFTFPLLLLLPVLFILRRIVMLPESFYIYFSSSPNNSVASSSLFLQLTTKYPSQHPSYFVVSYFLSLTFIIFATYLPCSSPVTFFVIMSESLSVPLTNTIFKPSDPVY